MFQVEVVTRFGQQDWESLKLFNEGGVSLVYQLHTDDIKVMISDGDNCSLGITVLSVSVVSLL